MLTLNEALHTNRLEEFIAQAEADGVEAANREMFDVFFGQAVEPRPEGQTSCSRGSRSKRGK